MGDCYPKPRIHTGSKTGVIVLPNGVAVKTDRESQALIASAALSAIIDPSYTCTWKATNGWVTLMGKDVLYVATEVRKHVQGCFDRERQINLDIDKAATLEELKKITWDASS